jgi:beta-alanine--pyruvate transaminase
MGGVIARKGIYDAFMRGPEHVIELFHGYTYSAHPLAVAAGLATLDLYKQEDIFARAKKMEPVWYDAAMTLKGLPGVLDIRCVGITCGIDLAARADAPGKRGYESLEYAFHDLNMMVRTAGDTIVCSPPLIVSEAQVGEIFDKIGKAIKAIQ